MADRFVILEHDFPTLHWDLMLEAGDVLKTWRLPEPPRAGTMTVEPLPDHRVRYLDYEGPVSGDRGAVARWDAGVFERVDDGFRLLGQRGVFRLRIIDAVAEWTVE